MSWCLSHLSLGSESPNGRFSSRVLEPAEHATRVNAVTPGAVAPDAVDTGTGSDDKTESDTELTVAKKSWPMDGSHRPRTGSYLFPASDDASFVTGHLLYVDGGCAVLWPRSVARSDRGERPQLVFAAVVAPLLDVVAVGGARARHLGE
ncbi:SDR family oxidoreductase [Haloferax prahovense]|uniref:SDR family oxidoreductase n=1 Tax=Haloferax prahovense TaxID=381852 RepID=UPI000A060B43|nr:SDR family oxidoreductase [Haloferax prahovense]